MLLELQNNKELLECGDRDSSDYSGSDSVLSDDDLSSTIHKAVIP